MSARRMASQNGGVACRQDRLIAYTVPVEGPAPGLFSLNVPSFVWPHFFVSELLTTNIMIFIYLK